MNPYHVALVLCLSSSLFGCDLADILEGKPSSFKAEVERRAALTIPSPSLVASVAPVVEAPECYSDSFRVSRCVAGKLEAWVY